MNPLCTVQVGQSCYRVVGPDGRPTARGSFDSEEALLEAVRDAFSQHRRRRWRLEVGRPWAQVRRVTDLPPVKARHLSGLVQSNAGRYFRVRPGELHVEAHRENEDTVLAIAIDGWISQGVSEAARSHGGGLVEASVVGAGDVRYPVTPRAVVRDRRWLGVRSVAAWIPVAVIPWVVAAGVYAADLRGDVVALEEARIELSAAEAELRSLEAAIGEAGTLVHAVERTGVRAAWAVPLLGSVSRHLPSTAYVTSLSVERTGPCVLELAGDTLGLEDALSWMADVRIEGSTVSASSCR